VTTDIGPDPDAVVAGLARELEMLRRRIDHLAALPRRVDDLAHLFARLADTTANSRGKATGSVAPSWLDHPADPGRPVESSRAARDAEALLAKLTGWVAGVYLRYTDARQLPDCWLWHPDVIEELLWLHAAWLAAHHPDAPASAVGDWHDRQRPGVARRIKDYAGLCSLEAHRPGGERHAPAPVAPTADAALVIASWWAVARDQPAPSPSAEQLDAAHRHAITRGRR
jgi:hypothetical protein